MPVATERSHKKSRQTMRIRSWLGVNGGVLIVAACASFAGTVVRGLTRSLAAAALASTGCLYLLVFFSAAATLRGRPRRLSPAARSAVTGLGAGVGIGMGYTDCKVEFDQVQSAAARRSRPPRGVRLLCLWRSR